MDFTLLPIVSLGFFLGIKHAIEPDHIIAVSTIASQSRKLSRSSMAGVFWGIGHSLTLFIVGMMLILLEGKMPETWAMSFEFLVGIMLVYLGITSILSYKKIHQKEHSNQRGLHKHHDVTYLKSMLIGLVHGIAGSGALVLLTMSTVKSVGEGAIYILLFAGGTIIGMLFFTTLIGIPFVLSTKKLTLNKALTQMTGLISIVFGLYYMYNLAVTEGLIRLLMQ
jgi:hypothetical protein